MEIILDNLKTFLTLLTAVLIAAGIFKSELRRFAKRSQRDIAFTMSKSELENVLNRSFEMNYRLVELTETRIHGQWEIRMLERELITSQKTKIRQLSGNMEVRFKSAYSELLREDRALQDSDRTVVYQQFSNALHVVSTNLRMKLYDVCNENDLTAKTGPEWDAWVRQMKVTLTLEALDHLRAIFLTSFQINNFDCFVKKADEILDQFIEYSLAFAKAEAADTKANINSFEEIVSSSIAEIITLREKKSLDLVHDFVENSKS